MEKRSPSAAFVSSSSFYKHMLNHVFAVPCCRMSCLGKFTLLPLVLLMFRWEKENFEFETQNVMINLIE